QRGEKGTMKKVRVGTGTPWEKQYGYARALRLGSVVAVSGTVAADDAGRAVADDAYGQTRAILSRIGEALERTGARLADVVRLRVYHADPAVGDGFGRALAEIFPYGAPALTAVRVAALSSPDFLLEIEADAVVDNERDNDDHDDDERRRYWDEGGD
ncbi:MAG TPA: Rid family hydrolase, partial [Thermoanaerobaculia bacterium]|nr:Rid family hydrolase [Thermoanaerobaculia bacterium]